VTLSIAQHGDPAQAELALRYPEQCEECSAPIHDRRRCQRYCADCVRAHRRAYFNAYWRERYRNDAEYRAKKSRQYRLRKYGVAA
jgi:hypothetical protein